METLTTTSQIEKVQQAFACFGQGDIAGILDMCTDDITWSTWNNTLVPFARTYSGKAGGAAFFTDLNNEMTYTAFEPRQLYACGDRVFAKVFESAIIKSTGKSFEQEALMEFAFRDGQVCSFFAYVDSAKQAAAFS